MLKSSPLENQNGPQTSSSSWFSQLSEGYLALTYLTQFVLCYSPSSLPGFPCSVSCLPVQGGVTSSPLYSHCTPHSHKPLRYSPGPPVLWFDQSAQRQALITHPGMHLKVETDDTHSWIWTNVYLVCRLGFSGRQGDLQESDDKKERKGGWDGGGFGLFLWLWCGLRWGALHTVG